MCSFTSIWSTYIHTHTHTQHNTHKRIRIFLSYTQSVLIRVLEKVILRKAGGPDEVFHRVLSGCVFTRSMYHFVYKTTRSSHQYSTGLIQRENEQNFVRKISLITIGSQQRSSPGLLTPNPAETPYSKHNWMITWGVCWCTESLCRSLAAKLQIRKVSMGFLQKQMILLAVQDNSLFTEEELKIKENLNSFSIGHYNDECKYVIISLQYTWLQLKYLFHCICKSFYTFCVVISALIHP